MSRAPSCLKPHDPDRVPHSGAVRTTTPTAWPAAARVGLLAGYGRFPILFAQAAARQGCDVICLAIRGEASPELAQLAARFHWVGVAQLGRTIRLFKREGVDRIVMAGKVHKKVMFTPHRLFQLMPDWRMIRMWYRLRRSDRRDDSVVYAIIDELARDHIRVEPALHWCQELLVKPGCLTRREPSAQEWRDIQVGWKLAKEMGRLDVGQSVAVKEQAVIAVEAIEGTDRMILRAGELCPAGGFTVVKVAKPQQDMRFDVPTIGPDTIHTLHRAGAGVLAIEADKTILLDQEETVRLADQHGISIVAVHAAEMAATGSRRAG